MPVRETAAFEAGEESLTGQIFKAIVIDNNDPEQCSRLLVRAVDLHAGHKDEELPWADDLLGEHGAYTKIGSLRPIPAIGTEVMCLVRDKEGYNISWLGAARATDVLVQELVASDYPFCYGYVNQSGDLFIVNTKRDTKLWIMASGMTLEVDGKGHIKLITADHAVGPDAVELYPAGITIQVIGDAVIQATKGVKIEGTQDIHISGAADIHIDATRDIIMQAGRNFQLNTVGTQGYAGVTHAQTTSGSAQPPPPTVTAPTAPDPRTRPKVPDPSGQTDL